MAETIVLPLSCVRDELLSLVPDDDDGMVMDLLGRADDRAVRNAFQPAPQSGSGWVSNLRLAKAVHDWIGKRKAGQTGTSFGQDLSVRIAQIIAERRLGFALVLELSQVASTTRAASADLLQRVGNNLRADRNMEGAAWSYAQARATYQEYARSIVADNPYQVPELGLLSQVRATVRGTLAAQAYKAAADVSQKLAEITGNPSDLEQAKSLAASAIFFAPTGSLRASSWATLGSASQAAGNNAVAVPAFTAAQREGFSALWARRALHQSVAKLGDRPPEELGERFLRDNLLTTLGRING
ncbi:MAG: hypothetical protein JO227_21685 [Acetobacteraceae bacterium]|nr:hypothetical protein [Acetobacteraceae bacterium]